LEEEKRELERHSQVVETALALRQSSQTAVNSLRRQDDKEAALAVQEYNKQARLNRQTPRALAYAGDSTVQQIEASEKVLRSTLFQLYEAAVEQENLQQLGDLTPLLNMVNLEKEGASMY
jgi:septal ring factor EnvC (AmiA/AmiB activator)